MKSTDDGSNKQIAPESPQLPQLRKVENPFLAPETIDRITEINKTFGSFGYTPGSELLINTIPATD